MRRIARNTGGSVAALLTMILAAGCSSGDEPQVAAPPTSTAAGDTLGRTATVVRRDLTLSFILDAVTSSAAENIDVSAALTPIQYLRFISRPFSGRATVETVMGQRQFACTALRATQSKASEGGSVASLRCRLPAAAETVPGLRARLSITSDTLKNVLVIPNLFIGYDDQRDGYYVNLSQGGKTAIKVGVTDGVVRVITAGIAEGDTLLPVTEVP